MLSLPHNYTGSCPLRLHSATSPPGGWTCQHETGICLLPCRFGEPPSLTAPCLDCKYLSRPTRKGWMAEGKKGLALGSAASWWPDTSLPLPPLIQSSLLEKLLSLLDQSPSSPDQSHSLSDQSLSLPPSTVRPWSWPSSSTGLCQLKKQVILFCVGGWGLGFRAHWPGAHWDALESLNRSEWLTSGCICSRCWVSFFTGLMQ